MTDFTKLGWHLQINTPLVGWQNITNNAQNYTFVGSELIFSELRNLTAQHGYSKTYAGRLISWESHPLANQKTPTLIDNLERYVDQYGLRHVWWETFSTIMPAMTPELAELDAYNVREFTRRGLKVIVGKFAMGYPQIQPYATAADPDLWPLYYPAFDAIQAVGPERALLGYQPYIPNLRTNPYNPDGSIHGDWLAVPLRFRWLEQYHLNPRGYNKVRFAGIEGSYDAPNFGGRRGLPSTGTFLSGLVELDKFLCADSRWVYCSLYTLDQAPDSHLFPFKDGLGAKVNAYQAGRLPAQSGPIGPAPVPVPTPIPTPTPTPTPLPTDFPFPATISSPANLRLGPSVTGPIVELLPAGTKVKILGETTDRYIVETSVVKTSVRAG